MLSQDDFVIAALVEEGILDRAKADEAACHAAEHTLSACEAIVALGM